MSERGKFQQNNFLSQGQVGRKEATTVFISQVERKCPYYKKKKKKRRGMYAEGNVCVGGNYELNYEL